MNTRPTLWLSTMPSFSNLSNCRFIVCHVYPVDLLSISGDAGDCCASAFLMSMGICSLNSLNGLFILFIENRGWCRLTSVCLRFFICKKTKVYPTIVGFPKSNVYPRILGFPKTNVYPEISGFPKVRFTLIY